MRHHRTIIVAAAIFVLCGCRGDDSLAEAAGNHAEGAAIAGNIQAAVDHAESDREAAGLAADKRHDDQRAARLAGLSH